MAIGNYTFKSPKGLFKRNVEEISWQKNEPAWMRKFRLASFQIFSQQKMPTWWEGISSLNLDNLYYYLRPLKKKASTWQELPSEIRRTYEKIGLPEAEKKFFGGISAQYESEVVYKSIKKSLAQKGVIFLDMDSALKEYPSLVKEYLSTVIPSSDNKFAALNSAFWSGGSFIYVPKGVEVELPLQAYFRINAAQLGQFERTLIIAEEGSFVHYVEGCSAPVYSSDSLHAGVVEIIVKKGARVRYSTVQNWSRNVYNLVTKRMKVEAEGTGEWIDGNIGSKLTLKYPSLYLVGKGARGEILSLASAGAGQWQDSGGKAIHLAPFTSANILSKSVSFQGGRATFRGMVKISKEAHETKTKVRCEALLLDEKSRSDTYPNFVLDNNRSQIEHEATVSQISREQLFYLRSRGLSKNEAETAIVNGFIEPIVKELPLEYAVELNRLIGLEMQKTVC